MSCSERLVAGVTLLTSLKWASASSTLFLTEQVGRRAGARSRGSRQCHVGGGIWQATATCAVATKTPIRLSDGGASATRTAGPTAQRPRANGVHFRADNHGKQRCGPPRTTTHLMPSAQIRTIEPAQALQDSPSPFRRTCGANASTLSRCWRNRWRPQETVARLSN